MYSVLSGYICHALGNKFLCSTYKNSIGRILVLMKKSIAYGYIKKGGRSGEEAENYWGRRTHVSKK